MAMAALQIAVQAQSILQNLLSFRTKVHTAWSGAEVEDLLQHPRWHLKDGTKAQPDTHDTILTAVARTPSRRRRRLPLVLRVLTGKADSIVREAELRGESIKEKKILQAKEKFIALKEKQANQRKDLDRKLNEREERIKRTESNLPADH